MSRTFTRKVEEVAFNQRMSQEVWWDHRDTVRSEADEELSRYMLNHGLVAVLDDEPREDVQLGIHHYWEEPLVHMIRRIRCIKWPRRA